MEDGWTSQKYVAGVECWQYRGEHLVLTFEYWENSTLNNGYLAVIRSHTLSYLIILWDAATNRGKLTCRPEALGTFPTSYYRPSRAIYQQDARLSGESQDREM